MVETELESSPVSKISNPRVFCKNPTELSKEEKKLKPKFPNATIVKISSPDVNFLDQVIAYLSIGFAVAPTSAKMFNSETKQFFEFVSVAPKLKEAQ
ncbi:MAG: hypothetical protein ABSF44_02400 [Candidatus Bathyarchaeia archaeon]